MSFLESMLNETQAVLDQGGLVLWAILLVGVWLYSILISTLRGTEPLKQEIEKGITNIHESEKVIQREYTIFLLEKLAWIDRRLPVIAVMIGICTLGGLLGTVAGMLSTFENMASAIQADPMQKVATGISKALITTQVGLLFALPASFIFALLRSRVKALHLLVEENFHKDIVQYHREGLK